MPGTVGWHTLIGRALAELAPTSGMAHDRFCVMLNLGLCPWKGPVDGYKPSTWTRQSNVNQ